MWYNNESDRKSICYADSPDLYNWTDKGKAIADKPGEGPSVFKWKNKYWMIVDNWKGLGVYSSGDLLNWTRQSNSILDLPGKGEDDEVMGGTLLLWSTTTGYICSILHIPEGCLALSLKIHMIQDEVRYRLWNWNLKTE